MIAWQKAMTLVKEIYELSAGFPADERFGLTAQLRRAAVSIPSNIAEGQGRAFDKEFARFLSNSMGSLMEVETQVMIAQDLGFLKKDAAETLLRQTGEIVRLVNGLMKKLTVTSRAVPDQS